MKYCLPLSKSSWLEGRVGPEIYQDCYTIVKNSIDLLKENKVDTLILLSDFKSRQSPKSELEYITEVCEKFSVPKDKLYIKKYGHDTISQLQFSLQLCDAITDELFIISSATHYPRVRWITYRLNRTYRVKVTHMVAWGIPRPRDAIFDIGLIFVYPILDLFGFSSWFTKHMKIRRDKGFLV